MHKPSAYTEIDHPFIPFHPAFPGTLITHQMNQCLIQAGFFQ